MKVTAIGSFTWSVSVWRPYLKAGSPVWNVEMVSESGEHFINRLLFGSFTTSHSLLPPGNHTCFSCKSAGQEVTRCSVPGCGCYYHEDCVLKLPGTTSSSGGGFCCPQHICSTCCLERDLQRASKGTELFYCVTASLISCTSLQMELWASELLLFHQQSVKNIYGK